jgi:hypothetical protein
MLAPVVALTVTVSVTGAVVQFGSNVCAGWRYPVRQSDVMQGTLYTNTFAMPLPALSDTVIVTFATSLGGGGALQTT